jgi:hypothetical protein
MTTEELLAREALRCLLADCVMAIDTGQLDAMLGHFTDDAVLETPRWTQRGRAAIREALRGAAAKRINPARTFVRHHITSSQLRLDSIEQASGHTYFIVFTDIGLDHAGSYEDRYKKVGNTWLIASRKIRADWVAGNSLSELGSGARAPAAHPTPPP